MAYTKSPWLGVFADLKLRIVILPVPDNGIYSPARREKHKYLSI
jgi:hypothetical protein